MKQFDFCSFFISSSWLAFNTIKKTTTLRRQNQFPNVVTNAKFKQKSELTKVRKFIINHKIFHFIIFQLGSSLSSIYLITMVSWRETHLTLSRVVFCVTYSTSFYVFHIHGLLSVSKREKDNSFIFSSTSSAIENECLLILLTLLGLLYSRIVWLVGNYLLQSDS
jgi:hypothetical protein